MWLRAGQSLGGWEGQNGGWLLPGPGQRASQSGRNAQPSNAHRKFQGSWHGQGFPWQPRPALPPEPLSTHTERLFSTDTRLTPLQFGNLQKLDGPMEQCQDPLPSPADNCTDEVSASQGSSSPSAPLPQVWGQQGGDSPCWGRSLGCPGERGPPSPRRWRIQPPLSRRSLCPPTSTCVPLPHVLSMWAMHL